MASKKTGNYLVPFDSAGNLLHWTSCSVGQLSPGHYGGAAEWRENTIIIGGLKLSDMHSGRSAKYVEWLDERGHRYPMFIADLVDFLKRSEVSHGYSYETARWVVRKRGQNYGIALAPDPEPVPTPTPEDKP